ncbi:MAG: metalloregulator ArsR/SmtB family transcription factor [Planctomycetota bacterium]
MSPFSDMTNDDAIWKALADPTRRELLDALRDEPRTTGDLCERFDDLCRTAVMKHLGILVDAGLVIVRREGRFRWNHLNPAPMQQIYERWMSPHVRRHAAAATRLQRVAEGLQRSAAERPTSPKAKKKRTKKTKSTKRR